MEWVASTLHTTSQHGLSMISSFRRVQNVVCFLLGDSPASDLYMPKMEQIECSETSAYINQTPGNHTKENKTTWFIPHY